MERIMLVMIVVVALVAVGGLLYVGVQKAPALTPIIVQGPMLAAPSPTAQDSVTSPVGTFRFTVAQQDGVTSPVGTFKFSVKQ